MDVPWSILCERCMRPDLSVHIVSEILLSACWRGGKSRNGAAAVSLVSEQ